jgi:hypothetical protein
MPTVATHALAGAGLGVVLAGPDWPPRFPLLTAGLAMAPDLDALATRGAGDGLPRRGCRPATTGPPRP